MKISAGLYRHRNLNITNLQTTRETSDKVRQAIFNLIGQFFDGGRALDLFAGCGSMGIEALSRGLDFVYFNDLEKKAIEVVKGNLETLKILNNAKLMSLNYSECLEELKEEKFDLIFLDPPYSLINVSEIVEKIIDLKVVSPDGLIVFEMKRDTIHPQSIKDFSIYKERTYGIKKVIVYNKK